MGRPEGVRVARDHHPDARVHPRPGLLLHGQQDAPARAARLVADQLLLERERDASVPCAARRPGPVA